jgi:hypothetical protein
MGGNVMVQGLKPNETTWEEQGRHVSHLQLRSLLDQSQQGGEEQFVLL